MSVGEPVAPCLGAGDGETRGWSDGGRSDATNTRTRLLNECVDERVEDTSKESI